MAVITISGELGSGARDVGRLVADLLEIDYVDRELLVDAARELGVSVDAMAERDERTRSFRQRLASVFRTFLEHSAASGAGDPFLGAGGLETILARTYGEASAESPGDIDDVTYIQTIKKIIRGLAEKDHIVIVGRGSHVILRDCAGAVHVLVVCPLAARVERVASQEGISRDAAEKRIADMDRGRLAFYRKFFKVDPNHPGLYDLVVNTGRLSVPAAASIVTAAVQTRMPHPG
jgi:cytidylate kinase